MIWLKKTFPRYGAEWGQDQMRFAELQLVVAADRTDAYRKMMMVTVEDQTNDHPATEDVYLRLPDSAYRHLFPGYELNYSGPAEISSLLVGDQTEVGRQFRMREEA